MSAGPYFDSAFKKKKEWGLFLCRLPTILYRCLSGFWQCFKCFEDERVLLLQSGCRRRVEMRERFKGACVLFHPGDHMQSG